MKFIKMMLASAALLAGSMPVVAHGQIQYDPVAVEQTLSSENTIDDNAAATNDEFDNDDIVSAKKKPKQPVPPTHCGWNSCWEDVGPRPF